MITSTSSRQSFLRLLQAARGVCDPKASKLLKPPRDLPTFKGNNSNASPSFQALPCFPLKAEHISSCTPGASSQEPRPSTPSEFHSTLCDLIRNAKHRVTLASLYIGTGGSDKTSPKENELLDAIEYASTKDPSNLKINVLLDANRSLRPIKKNSNPGENNLTSSADAVYSRIQQGNLSNLSQTCQKSKENDENQLHLFNVLDFPKTLLPSPLNEVVGVFHLKAYIIDDNLILSGANLSEEYFTDRQDRYMLFVNGGGGLVDFYSDLIEILCEYGTPYNGRDSSNNAMPFKIKEKKEKLYNSISLLFDSTNEKYSSSDQFQNAYKDDFHNDYSFEDATNVVAYAVPTLQLPKTFLSTPFPFLCDTHLLQHVIFTAMREFKEHASIRISSAYLNPTFSLMETLKAFGRRSLHKLPNVSAETTSIFLLSAGPLSHGFSPKKVVKTSKGNKSHEKASEGKGRDWIPKAFAAVANNVGDEISSCGGKICLFERVGWTFHAKGLWLSTSSLNKTEINETNCPKFLEKEKLLLSIIGSGNYGARSEDLDVESNCIIVHNLFEEEKLGKDSKVDEKPCLSHLLLHEWDFMCGYSKMQSNSNDDTQQKDEEIGLRLVLPIVRKFL